MDYEFYCRPLLYTAPNTGSGSGTGGGTV